MIDGVAQGLKGIRKSKSSFPVPLSNGWVRSSQWSTRSLLRNKSMTKGGISSSTYKNGQITPWMQQKSFGSSFGVDGTTIRNTKRLMDRFEKLGDEGFYTIIGHGSNARPGVTANFGGDDLTADEVYALMIKDGYVQGTPIRAVICNSGCNSSIFAQRLSNLSGAKVQAPTSKVALDDSGKFVFQGDGGWRSFEPRKDIDDIH